DYLRGFTLFRFAEPWVTVLGSARLDADSDFYKLTRSVGTALGEAGFTVMTGGGPGLMEAAYPGAFEAGGRSFGWHLALAFEDSNRYLDRCVKFRYLLIRKLMLFRCSCAFVVVPGGLGTMDELFEILTLIKTKKMAQVPIVMIGEDYWRPLVGVFERMIST